MKKPLLKIVLAGLVFCGVLAATSTVQAKKPYSWSVMDGPLMYYTKPNVKGYVWNYSHTRKLHNVKTIVIRVGWLLTLPPKGLKVKDQFTIGSILLIRKLKGSFGAVILQKQLPRH
ncbi:hypothetical protein [Lentilactobacillus parafarraginis]|uniref:hypothetical protein n=1 Tax=Lentilactobacillus parafarraginis TaxID=390842 RepID=UPI0006CF6A29|nr:hypothetical protein [Lentilactobacillus parafarraginis]